MSDVTVTIKFDDVTHDQLRRAFNVTFMPMCEFLNLVADGDPEDEDLEKAFQLLIAGRNEAVAILGTDDE